MAKAPVRPFQKGLQTPIQFVKGVGPKLAFLFEKKGIRTVEDALYFLPRRYEDRREMKKLSELGEKGRETGFGEVLHSGTVFTPQRRRKVFEAVVGDGTGVITLKWFHGNRRYLHSQFRKGTKLVFSGEMKWYGSKKEIFHPDVEFIGEDGENDSLNFGRIVPIYSETEGLHQRTLRRLARRILDDYSHALRSSLPPEIAERLGLIDFREAFHRVHFPPHDEPLEALNLQKSAGHRRIVFEEFFLLELGLAMRKREAAVQQGIAFKSLGPLSRALLDLLPFGLTRAQERVSDEIRQDMERPVPMNRLIQGDVGSGKTIVALLACLRAVECGFQAAIMAPTEVLAEQHFFNLRFWVERLDLRGALLTSNVKGTDRDDLYREIREGKIQIVIGTHAIIQETVEFSRLGLAVIDEQHKFGVVQRGLFKKKGTHPDVLVMTATPIPRTLAMTVYGDLDVSIIDEMPAGRMPVETRCLPESARERAYRILEEEVKKGRQAFFVCPLVEESEKLDLRDATRMAEHLQTEVFPGVRIGLLHGRMRSDEKEEVMMAFKAGKIAILVSTTVIEVGVDVPNASVMVVEHAERFGLSQLHQLRGRIGRGRYPSKCILLAQSRSSEEARVRLRAMERTSDGFEIAEEDLALRGPGEFLGTKQSGLPDLRVAHLIRDTPILMEARKEAFRLIETDPELGRADHLALRDIVTGRLKEKLDLGTIA